MDLQKATEQITHAGQVILNKLRSTEDVIGEGVFMTNVIADLNFEINKKLAEIRMRPENSGKQDNYLKTLFRIETNQETRLLSIAKGYKATLRHIEYEDYK
jgi:hypothetical protein